MNTLKELLRSDTDNLDADLRKAFRPLSSGLDITGCELDALTILVNLTDTVPEQKNLLDRNKCREKLRDEHWWARCLKTVQYRQSHNVKFPNILATGIIRANPIGDIPDHLLSSSKLSIQGWCYSKNSTDVNYCAFLTSEFYWGEQCSCLGSLLTDESHFLWNQLRKLGCYQKQRIAIAKRLKCIPNQNIDVPLCSNYIPQVMVRADNENYLSISPVVAQSMQIGCNQTLTDNFKYSKITKYSRATNMGVLSMMRGGAFRMLSSVPKFQNQQHFYKDQSNYWLTSEYIKAFIHYFEQPKQLLTVNRKKKHKRKLRTQLKEMLTLWLSTKGIAISEHEERLHQLNFELAKTHSLKKYAYQPYVIRSLSKLLYQVREDVECISAQPTEEQQSDRYLLLPNIIVSGASAHNSPYSIGLPAMTALWGFIHAFERQLKEVGESVTFDSFAVCIHDYSHQNRGLTHELIQNTKKKISLPATQDYWQCDFTVTLIMRCTNCDFDEVDKYVPLIPKRLSRGYARIPIESLSKIRIYDDFFQSVEDIPIQSGQWLSMSQEKISHFDDLVYQLKQDDRKTPTLMGYHFLEKPVNRGGSLNNHPHVFSESILGLIQLRSISPKTNLSNIFWHSNYRENYFSIETRSVSDGNTNDSGI